MKRLRKTILIFIILFGVIVLWYWADKMDYFQSDYKEYSPEEERLFKWQDGDNDEKLKNRYESNFSNDNYTFPRQKVHSIRLFKNIPMISTFSSKSLNRNQIDKFLMFCNDTTNFSWAETTWDISESEYYFRLYNQENKVVGKIYFCIDKCGMISSKPFCPSMKFGALSEIGRINIKSFIENQENWK
ncbi:MAG: hypothetical protein RJA13_954 [Bacteroidota bacterium]|jgi:hypothetical protein